MVFGEKIIMSPKTIEWKILVLQDSSGSHLTLKGLVEVLNIKGVKSTPCFGTFALIGPDHASMYDIVSLNRPSITLTSKFIVHLDSCLHR